MKEKAMCQSCLENPTDREAWQATVHGVTRVGCDLVTKPQVTPEKVGRMFSQVYSTHRVWPHLTDIGYLNNKAALQVNKEEKTKLNSN